MKAFLLKSFEFGFFIVAVVMMIPFMTIFIVLTALGALAYAPFHLMNVFRNKQ